MEAKFFIWCFTEESLICFRTGGVWSHCVMGLLSYCSLLYRVAGLNLQNPELILHILSRINYNSRNPAHTYSSECWRPLLNFSEKIPEYFKKQNLNLLQIDNYLHSPFIVFFNIYIAFTWSVAFTLLFWLFSHVQFFCDPMDCSPPGSSVHWISQARMLGWVAISSSRGSSLY